MPYPPTEIPAAHGKGTKSLWHPRLDVLPVLAIFSAGALYASHFFFGSGSVHRILDSWAYLQMSSGERANVPFNTRILTPSVAALVAETTGLSPATAFQLITPAALLAAMLTLRSLMRRRGGSPEWQAAVLVAFGCSLAVTFGYTPILVDPVLLLITCLTLAALDHGFFLVALGLVCLAAITKEFGLVLGVVWCSYGWRGGLGKTAFNGLVLPAAAFLMVFFARPTDATIGFPGWRAFASHVILEYQLSVFRVRGPREYGKLVYMWSWCGLWPALVLSSNAILASLRKRVKLSADDIGLLIMLLCLPVLIMGDWSRNLIIVVPFASIVATRHPLANDRYFACLIGVGGLTTALARPFHSESPPPQMLLLLMAILSVISSILIATKIAQFVMSDRGKAVQPGANSTRESAPSSHECHY